MPILRWVGFAALLIPAGAGVFCALLFAGFSVMGFDAPGSDKQAWPYLLMAGAVIALLGSAFLVLYAAAAMIDGRTKAACLCLLPPAALAGVFLYWVSLA